MKSQIASTIRIFINCLIFILIVHLLIKHFLLHNNFIRNKENTKEEFTQYCNDILKESVDNSMKDDLQKYLDGQDFLEKNEIDDIDNLDNIHEAPSDLSLDKKKSYYDSEPVKNFHKITNDPKNEQYNKKLNNDFDKPDMWLYDDENIMNGGNINDNLVAYDNFNSGFASFDDNNIITKC